MDLWHILVLAVVRHTLGTNWDRLHDMANYHEQIRKIMGVHASAFMEDDRVEFGYQTILDNVYLLDETVLAEVNQLVVEAGHSLLKKRRSS